MNTRKNWIQNVSSQYYSVEETITDVQNDFDVRRYYSAEGASVKIDDITVQVIIQSHSNPLNEGKYDKKIHMPIDTVVNTGSIVEWDDDNWIIISSIDSLQAYKSASMIKSNNILSYYSNENSVLWTLKTIPFIIDSNYNMKSEIGDILSLNVDTVIINIPNNNETDIIVVNTRFIVGKQVYIIVDIDDLSKPGLRRLQIKKCEFNDDDNRDLQIADYYKYQNIYSINLISSSTLNLFFDNETSIIDVNCFVNGILDSSPTLSITSSNINVCTVNSITKTITCIGTGTSNVVVNYHGQTVTIVVNGLITGENDNYKLKIIGEDYIKIGQQSLYEAIITNDGTEEMRNVVWSLYAEDGVSSTTLASIISTTGTYGENIIVKANSNVSFGYVKLKCRTDTSLYNDIKTIEIKPLL